jgi:hypothetical protein
MTNFNPSNFSCGTLMRSRSQMPLLSRQGDLGGLLPRLQSDAHLLYCFATISKNIFTGLAPFTKFSYKLATPKMRNFKPLSVAKTPHWIEIQSAPESPPSHDRLRNEIQRAIQEAEYFPQERHVHCRAPYLGRRTPGATRFYLDRFRERVRTEHPRAVLLAKEKCR